MHFFSFLSEVLGVCLVISVNREKIGLSHTLKKWYNTSFLPPVVTHTTHTHTHTHTHTTHTHTTHTHTPLGSNILCCVEKLHRQWRGKVTHAIMRSLNKSRFLWCMSESSYWQQLYTLPLFPRFHLSSVSAPVSISIWNGKRLFLLAWLLYKQTNNNNNNVKIALK